MNRCFSYFLYNLEQTRKPYKIWHLFSGTYFATRKLPNSSCYLEFGVYCTL